jgi:FecR protein
MWRLIVLRSRDNGKSAFIRHSAGGVLNRKLSSPPSFPGSGRIVTRHGFSFALALLGCLVIACAPCASAMRSPMEAGPVTVSVDEMSDATRLAQTQPPPAPTTAPSPAQPTADEPIGNVATLTGSATVTRNQNSIPLKLQDDIFLNDVLQTAANSTLGVTFNDATTFRLTANAKITVDDFVYDSGGKQNAALFDIAKGTVAFVAAAVAKTGDMKISTPTATLGIRGTTGLVEVPEGTSAAIANNVAIKLYPDPNGRVGRIEVNGRDGARLGFLTQGASGFTIRPGAGGRFAALPLTISPQQALRDQGIVRQVHSAQSVGRQIVSRRRIQRLQNPAGRPGLQRQNGSPQRPGSPQQPGQPNRPGQQQRQQQPGLQRQPNVPAVRPVQQDRPALQKLRPAAPALKRKLPKERR